MDPVTMLYYAAVCSTLSVSMGPQRWPLRLIIGAIVGVVAVAILPLARSAAGL